MKLSDEEIFYRTAMSFIPGVGSRTMSSLIQHFGSAKEALSATLQELTCIENIGAIKAAACKNAEIFRLAEQETTFVLQHGIEILSRGDDQYPARLQHCADAPWILYSKGKANFNSKQVIAVVGTRRNTEYGQRLCQDLLSALGHQKDLLVISGLAHGIDTIAHRNALKHRIPTAAILPHGLHTIYPSANYTLAKEILTEHGSLITEFGSGSSMEKGNFAARNRIIAGLADITIVVESDIKGGALTTAYMAAAYNKAVAAFPGKAYDPKSAGTNMLIQKRIASLVNSADDVLQLMNWKGENKDEVVSKQLLLQLSETEYHILDFLGSKENAHADEIQAHCGMSITSLTTILLQMEMQGLICTLPGKVYRSN